MILNEHAWYKIGANEQVLEWIKNGIQIPLERYCQPFHLNNHKIDIHGLTFLDEEIERLLKAGFIKECETKPDHISPIGCVKKKSGGYRLITDLRELNKHCLKSSFKQEDIRTVEQIIKPNDYLASIDLQDGFYHIKVHESSQKFLSFQHRNKFYSFKVLCFGFCLSPYFFYKCLRPIVEYLRSFDIRLSLFVDDWFICAEKHLFRDHVDTVIHTLEDLGLKINYEKSDIQPSQSVEYLGYHINTEGNFPIIKTKQERVKRIKRLVRDIIKKEKVTARVLAKCAGLCISTAWTVAPGKLFLRHIYRLLSQKSSWDDLISINKYAMQELKWWLEAIDEFNYREVKLCPIDVSLEVDASALGWGACIGDKLAKGDFCDKLSRASSNCRELSAVYLSLLAFKKVIQNKHVLILSDNITAIAYIRNKGGPSPKLSKLAIAIWAEAEKLGLSITCRHLAGVSNITADRLSRSPDKHNWMLHPNLFALLDELWGPHSIDRFATFQNAQIMRFNSRFWEPGSEAVDSMLQDWSKDNNYINPPWVMLPKIVEKIISEKALATVIAPMFPGQPWCQKLKQMSVCSPMILPKHKNTLCFKGKQAEPKRNLGWSIAAWKVHGGLA